jgi:hypothetical protein
MQGSLIMRRYEAVNCYEATYSVWVQTLSYGRRGLGLPAVDLEPVVSGLVKEDADMWALGTAHVMLSSGNWRIVKDTMRDDKANKAKERVIVVEDELAAKRSILVALDFVQKDGTVTIEATPLNMPVPKGDKTKRSTRTAKSRRKVIRRR